ncbi:MAG: tetratricopeptide repeat protein [Methylobacter sp.]|nr:tetratricopeptide repeat protein [Methylobacter sp.]
MSLKQLALICTLPSFIAGCAGLYGPQPPAPVIGGQPATLPRPAQTQSPEVNKNLPETIQTEPLKESGPMPAPIELKPEPSAPELEQEQESETSIPTPFAPLESSASLSPAVGALVSAANQNTEAGNLESAVSSIERAIRIEPRNATLFYKLAVLRLKQSKPGLAEDLAKKSALLASSDITLKKHSWLLIAKTREMQKDFTGAKEARAKAASF